MAKPRTESKGAKGGKRLRPGKKRERDADSDDVFAGRTPCLPLDDLRALVKDIESIVRALPDSPTARALALYAAQSRVAIEACARDPFCDGLHGALTTKVLELETEALVAHRVARQQRALG